MAFYRRFWSQCSLLTLVLLFLCYGSAIMDVLLFVVVRLIHSIRFIHSATNKRSRFHHVIKSIRRLLHLSPSRIIPCRPEPTAKEITTTLQEDPTPAVDRPTIIQTMMGATTTPMITGRPITTMEMEVPRTLLLLPSKCECVTREREALVALLL